MKSTSFSSSSFFKFTLNVNLFIGGITHVLLVEVYEDTTFSRLLPFEKVRGRSEINYVDCFTFLLVYLNPVYQNSIIAF